MIAERRHRLITIPISHFCEKARWALDRGRVPYTEERHVQVFHAVHALRAGGRRTVPVLVAGDGAVLRESSEIVRWVDQHLDPADRLYPEGPLGAEAARIEAWLDAGLGPDSRLWMYDAALPVAGKLVPSLVDGTPRGERWAMTYGHRVLAPVLGRLLDVTPANAVAALDRVNATFDEVAVMLADGRPYLCGERLTAGDLAFAALTAPMLIPENYGSPLPPLDALPSSMLTEVHRLREHDAGRFATRLYAGRREQVTRG